ncbi:hypothetical protein T07_1523 [Trichinella nelsoni]|uniref:Uncharacterized protein n=1 Tax=Trichinella nelsoni TaxID=6336 RepID=A0A0V0RYT0_9BILA|nr:hypothetical protein T07_1523 [Trichinella nelsoni]
MNYLIQFQLDSTRFFVEPIMPASLCVSRNVFPDFVLVLEQDPDDLWEVWGNVSPVGYTWHS